MDKHLEPQPGQILCLEHGDRNLYVELIQLVTARNLYWVRPLLLVDNSCEPPLIEDLRNASDLLWQPNLFRVALDTEVITYFHQVLAKEPQPDSEPLAKQQLNHFIQQVWQTQGKEGKSEGGKE
ncbi:MAG: hypothetical protein QNJ51_03980 [Calothrix sp. MO_167.B12]|nr:hypothetical protein [Calothrix sp. MO_167.B12]